MDRSSRKYPSDHTGSQNLPPTLSAMPRMHIRFCTAGLLALIGVSEAFLTPSASTLSAIARVDGRSSLSRVGNSRSATQPLQAAQTSRPASLRNLGPVMVATKPQTKKSVKKGTDPEKLKLGPYELFPADESKMNMDLDLSAFKFEGARDLRRLYHDSDEIIVAEYYMSKCPTCRMMRQLMKPLMNKLQDRVQFVEVDVLANQDVIRQAGLLSVPTVQVFKRGKLIDHFNGLQTATKLRHRFTALLEEHGNFDVY